MSERLCVTETSALPRRIQVDGYPHLGTRTVDQRMHEVFIDAQGRIEAFAQGRRKVAVQWRGLPKGLSGSDLHCYMEQASWKITLCNDGSFSVSCDGKLNAGGNTVIGRDGRKITPSPEWESHFAKYFKKADEYRAGLASPQLKVFNEGMQSHMQLALLCALAIRENDLEGVKCFLRFYDGYFPRASIVTGYESPIVYIMKRQPINLEILEAVLRCVFEYAKNSLINASHVEDILTSCLCEMIKHWARQGKLPDAEAVVKLTQYRNAFGASLDHLPQHDSNEVSCKDHPSPLMLIGDLKVQHQIAAYVALFPRCGWACRLDRQLYPEKAEYRYFDPNLALRRMLKDLEQALRDRKLGDWDCQNILQRIDRLIEAGVTGSDDLLLQAFEFLNDCYVERVKLNDESVKVLRKIVMGIIKHRKDAGYPKKSDDLLMNVLRCRAAEEILWGVLESGANVNYVNNNMTPLMVAFKCHPKWIRIVDIFLRFGVNVNPPIRRNSPLCVALRNFNAIDARLLINAGAQHNYEDWGLHIYDYKKSIGVETSKIIECIKIMLEGGADPDAIDPENGLTLLGYICALGVNQGFGKEMIELIGVLKDHGADARLIPHDTQRKMQKSDRDWLGLELPPYSAEIQTLSRDIIVQMGPCSVKRTATTQYNALLEALNSALFDSEVATLFRGGQSAAITARDQFLEFVAPRLKNSIEANFHVAEQALNAEEIKSDCLSIVTTWEAQHRDRLLKEQRSLDQMNYLQQRLQMLESGQAAAAAENAARLEQEQQQNAQLEEQLKALQKKLDQNQELLQRVKKEAEAASSAASSAAASAYVASKRW